MDIRNFFKPSGGNKTKKKKSSAPSSNSESKKKSSKSTNKKRNIKDEEDENEDGLKNESVTEVGKTTSKSSKEKSNKKRRVVNIEDDEKSDITVEDVVKQKEKKSKTSKKISTPSSTSKNDNSKKKRVEVSVDDFFSGSTETDPVKKKKQKKKRKTIIESDDDDDYNDDDFKAESEGESEHEMMDVDDGEDDFIAPKKKATNKRKIESPIKKGEADTDEDKTSSSAKKKKPAPRKKTTTASPKKPAKKKPKKEKFLVKPCEPYPQHPFTISDEASSNCLEGITFVFTGVLSNLSREEAEDMCKEYGGRVVKAVSGRVNYLVCGSELEDGRDYTEGSKYKKATELGPTSITVLTSQEEFYGVIQLLREKNLKEQPQPAQQEKKNEKEGKKEATTKPVVNPYAAKPANPYASNKPVNPYAKPVNPYAKTSTSTSMKNPYASSTSTKLNRSTATTTTKPAGPSGGRAQANDPNALWADKYAPSSSKFILGNGETVRKLSDWLRKFEDTFVNVPKGKKKGFGGRTYKAALLSGPPGIGKTTTAFLVATEAGREVLELNASDARSKKTLSQTLGDVTGSQVLNFDSNKKSASNNKKRCIIMDEVDGMGAGDRSGMSELINMIKKSKVPIICICNDRQSQKVKSLAGHCLDLRFKRPVKSMIARRTVEVGKLEGMQIEQNAAEAIVESCGNDIRQVMNCIQMWASKNKDQKQTMRYKDVKERLSSIDKDEILRVSMFEATVKIVEGPKGVGMGENLDLKKAKDSLYKRCDAFFTDYNLMGLMTHQNYPKVMVSQFSKTKASGDSDAEAAVMDRLHDATLSMSDYALTENSLRAGQAWSLLPLCSILCVKTGFHAAGEGGAFYGGYPEFSSWLGKNSSKGKRTRILQELNHHMNYKVSSDKSELRLRYLPILKQRFAELFQEASEDKSKFSEIIELMDKYGLDRDDLFEGMDEFGFPESSKQEQKEFKFASLDSKTKAAFTREYNKGTHKSQALAAKQIASKVGKKRKTKSDDDVMMGDDDEDGGVESDDEKDIDDDIEAIQNMFKSKKKKGSTAKGGAKGKRTTKKSKK